MQAFAIPDVDVILTVAVPQAEGRISPSKTPSSVRLPLDALHQNGVSHKGE